MLVQDVASWLSCVSQRNVNAQIDAVELDMESYVESNDNAQSSPWKERISVYHSSVQQYSSDSDGTYDHIISNPPYYESHNCDDEQRQSARQTGRSISGRFS